MTLLTKSILLKYYKRPEIQNAIIEHADHKECAVRYDESFGKRPDILKYPREILELALQNVTSFHCSEELWSNPLNLSTDSSRKDLDSLRIGWDLVLDIDYKELEYSKIAADLIIQFLRSTGVQDVSVKFSGNKGFHIGVPFEAFPKKIGDILTKDLFPEAPKKIDLYIRERIKRELSQRILALENGNVDNIKKKMNKDSSQMMTQEGSTTKLNLDALLEIDAILLSSRHLYRMPYSLHEKSGLASIPIDPSTVIQFERSRAVPEKITVSSFPFLSRENVSESARNLLLQALDFKIKSQEQPEAKKDFAETDIDSPIREEFFPPCMQAILKGMEDGKKRAVFCLMNFLGKVGWNKKQIEEYLLQWNKEKNRQPLPEKYIKMQLAHFIAGTKLPPNCDNDAYYKDMGVYCNAEHCRRLKNPVNYTLRRWRRMIQEKEDTPRRKKAEKEVQQPQPNFPQPL